MSFALYFTVLFFTLFHLLAGQTFVGCLPSNVFLATPWVAVSSLGPTASGCSLILTRFIYKDKFKAVKFFEGPTDWRTYKHYYRSNLPEIRIFLKFIHWVKHFLSSGLNLIIAPLYLSSWVGWWSQKLGLKRTQPLIRVGTDLANRFRVRSCSWVIFIS